MNQLDRKTPPQAHPIGHITYLTPTEHCLSNGVKIYAIDGGSEEVAKIDLIFDAGLWYQSKNQMAMIANLMINEGTTQHSAHQIAEEFDFYGAYLNLSIDQHYGHISVVTLNRYLKEILEITGKIITSSTFPEDRLDTLIAKRKHKFQIENEKVKTLCLKKFSQVMFGEEHPYSNNNKLEDFDLLSKDDLFAFYKKHYTPDNCRIIVSGKISDRTINLLEEFLGAEKWPCQKAVSAQSFDITPHNSKEYFIEKIDAVQAAIRVGKLMFNKTHPDYAGFQVLNTILGGYFGSRLMTNIREEKGYTYGIGSALVSLEQAGYFFITSEVGNDVCHPALKEVYKEIARLRDELVPKEELDVVRNYMLGELLRDFDGPFSQAGSFNDILLYGLDNTFYDNIANTIRTITAEEIQRLAQKYLQEDSLIEVVAGKR